MSAFEPEEEEAFSPQHPHQRANGKLDLGN